MIGSTGQRRLLVCWGISILLHAGLLTFGVALLIKRASFQVEAGKTSTEMELTIESVPVPPVTLPAPTSLPVALLPPVRSAPVPEPINPQVTTTPESIFMPPIPSVAAPAKPQPPKPLASSRTAPTPETSSPVSYTHRRKSCRVLCNSFAYSSCKRFA